MHPLDDTTEENQPLDIPLLNDARQLAQIGDSIEEGVFVLDREGRLLFINRAALEILGYRRRELLGKPFRPFPSGENPIRHVLAGGEIHRNPDDFFLTKGGETVPVSHYTTPLFQEEEIIGTVTVLRNIAEEKKNRETLEKAKNQEETLLRYQNKYHSLQEKMAFEKQLKIMKDQLSSTRTGEILVETRYQPLDILSGDTYGTIILGDGMYLLYLVDAMGKGLSASVTSIQSSSFINHALDKGAHELNFDPKRLITSFTEYIKKKLLDDEMLCAAFLAIDEIGGFFQYAGFGMPPLLVERLDGTLEEIRCNNLPIMSFTSGVELSTHDFHEAKKILLYSDGLNEGTVDGVRLYDHYLGEDFLRSATLKQLHRRFLEKTGEPEDDLTMIMVRKTPVGTTNVWKGTAENAGETDRMLAEAQSWLEERLPSPHLAGRAAAATALLAEHAMKRGEKPLRLALAVDETEKLLVAVMADSGDGFDAADFFKKLHLGTQEGSKEIAAAFQKADGLYFNEKGNEATFLLDLRNSRPHTPRTEKDRA